MHTFFSIKITIKIGVQRATQFLTSWELFSLLNKMESCRTWIWCQKATSSSIISNGGHWREFRKKSNEQFQDQWLQQVNVYIPFMYLRSFPCWFLTTSSNTARRTTELIWTTQQHIKGVHNWKCPKLTHAHTFCHGVVTMCSHVSKNDPWNATKYLFF